MPTLNILFLGVLAYPICEEIIFRGVIQSELLKRLKFGSHFLGLSWANILTSILFAVTHVISFADVMMLKVFIPSLIFGWVYEIKRKVYVPIFLHGWYNFCSLFTVIDY